MAGARDKMEWLLEGSVRLPSGAYLSWLSDDHSGFTYPETAAVIVRAACWWSRTGGTFEPLRLIPTLAFLDEAVADDGLVHHRETAWLFDSLLALCALGTAQEAGIGYPSSAPIERLARGCTEMLTGGHAARPAQDARWSTRFGPHLLKPASLILALGLGPRYLRDAIQEALPALLSQQTPLGAFRHPDESRIYLHAHCYALEGLAVLGSAPEQLKRGLSFLRSQRRTDGGYGHWADAPSPLAADVTAQAGRIFLLTGDREAAAEARAALAPLVAASGGLRYHADSSHENSWATAFAAQLDYGLDSGLDATELA